MRLLAEEAARFGWQLTEKQLVQFERYQTLLLEWNQRVNLTAIRESRSIQLRHFLDSLTCTTVTGDLNGFHLVDVGTGAGFPGLPLKICYPDLSLTLIDSITKKTRFLQEVVDELGLSDVTVITERAEIVGHQTSHRGRYDWVMSRGVAELRVLVEYLLPLCRLGGNVLAQKQEDIADEVSNAQTAIQVLGGSTPQLHSIHLPSLERTHQLVLIHKVTPTPSRYPRRAGVPVKRPL